MRSRHLLSVLLFALSACAASALPQTTIEDITLNDTTMTFHLRNRDERFSVTLPQGWEKQDVETGDEMMTWNAPRSAFGIAVYVPTMTDGKGPPDDPAWEKGALAAIRGPLEQKSPAEYTWKGSRELELFGRPALETTVQQKDGTFVRDTYFFRNGFLFTASFVTEENGLETVWPSVEEALEAMTFDDVTK